MNLSYSSLSLFSILTSSADYSPPSATKFYETTSGDETPTTVSGLFQCRGDISTETATIAKKAPNLEQKLCGQAIAARVKLNGYYLRYEISRFRQRSDFHHPFQVNSLSSSTPTPNPLPSPPTPTPFSTAYIAASDSIDKASAFESSNFFSSIPLG
ncbi:plasmodesmata-located protein 2-like [Salvia divinorum]|uniref:Plasmodesmata-located protein 2-like n=1 Tax=Salvia divinorum TaxID=28513 RepID=A0ABD1I5Q5_SALDI